MNNQTGRLRPDAQTVTLTQRERTLRLGRCTGPHDGAPTPGEVGPGRRAPCCTCGRLVAVTIHGRYTHHKPSAKYPGRPRTRSPIDLTDEELSAFEYHGCSSDTATPPMVRDAIVRAVAEIRRHRAKS